MPPKWSVIVPVCSWPDPANMSGLPHPQLRAALDSVKAAGSDVELLVGTDGECPIVMQAVHGWAIDAGWVDRTKMIVCPKLPYKSWGNSQRNALLAHATGAMVYHQDQDDRFVPGVLGVLDEVVRENPGRPIVGRMLVYRYGEHGASMPEPDILWKERGRVEEGHFGGHMLASPNEPDMIGPWAPEDLYQADFRHVSETLRRFREAGREEVWVETVISLVRPWAAGL